MPDDRTISYRIPLAVFACIVIVLGAFVCMLICTMCCCGNAVDAPRPNQNILRRRRVIRRGERVTRVPGEEEEEAGSIGCPEIRIEEVIEEAEIQPVEQPRVRRDPTHVQEHIEFMQLLEQVENPESRHL